MFDREPFLQGAVGRLRRHGRLLVAVDLGHELGCVAPGVFLTGGGGGGRAAGVWLTAGVGFTTGVGLTAGVWLTAGASLTAGVWLTAGVSLAAGASLAGDSLRTFPNAVCADVVSAVRRMPARRTSSWLIASAASRSSAWRPDRRCVRRRPRARRRRRGSPVMTGKVTVHGSPGRSAGCPSRDISPVKTMRPAFTARVNAESVASENSNSLVIAATPVKPTLRHPCRRFALALTTNSAARRKDGADAVDEPVEDLRDIAGFIDREAHLRNGSDTTSTAGGGAMRPAVLPLRRGLLVCCCWRAPAWRRFRFQRAR